MRLTCHRLKAHKAQIYSTFENTFLQHACRVYTSSVVAFGNSTQISCVNETSLCHCNKHASFLKGKINISLCLHLSHNGYKIKLFRLIFAFDKFALQNNRNEQ